MQQQLYESQEEVLLAKMAADAHLHLDLFEDPEATVRAARNSGIGILVSAGSDWKSNIRNAELAHDGVYAVVGIDPEFALEDEIEVLERLEGLVKGNSNIVGIGEIGLDYKKAADADQKERQKRFFERQLEIAQALDLPVVIHARKALGDVFEILPSYKTRAMFHYFEGGREEALAAEKLGAIISVPPIESKKRIAAVRAVGIGSVVAETDAPVAGKTPTDVLKSIAMIAAATGVTYEEAVAITTENLMRFFRI
ncbi:MAG: TatD family hydrolase [Candidatus Micrarchaeia archaeon]